MSFWSEMRPPMATEPSDRPTRRTLVRTFRRGLLYAPLAVALIAAAGGLFAVAKQQSTAREPLIVQTVDLPTSSTQRLIDLNTATIAELATLPGVGETRARAIVATREQAPLRSITDLVDRGILRLTDLSAIAEQATVYVFID